LIYGIVGYFAVGALVYIGEQLADGLGSYRRARHILAFACAPLALSLVVWPLRLALYGGDNFRSGGSDTGTGGSAFEGIETAAVMRAATGAGIASSTSDIAPARSSSRASSTSRWAASAVLPWVLKPPSIVADWGVRPMCAITGIPASTIRWTRETIGPAPSSL